MNFITFHFPILLSLYSSQASVFLWSNKKLELSALQPFTNQQLLNLSKVLGDPDVYYFRTSSRISPKIKDEIDGYYSAYIPNGDINIEESIDLSGNDVLDAETVRETLSQVNKSCNILSVIYISQKQYKREIDEVTTELPDENKSSPQKKGPVIYTGQNKKNEYALLYSSKPLLLRFLRTNESDPVEMHLGHTSHDMIIYDTRLNVRVVPFGKSNKITLRFIFSWLNGYWSLPSVKITDDENDKQYNLTTTEDIMAPAHFSYHCNGFSVFTDKSGDVELYIYDLQVQIDSKNGKFGDVNDCVTFTTAPIWSGLFVTTLLGIGLIIALTAIMDIKTMDKFDNHKTKNLNVTISE